MITTTTTRRAVLAGSAALPFAMPSWPALALAPAGDGPDPMFAAIETHKRLASDLAAVLAERGAAEEQWQRERGGMFPRVVVATGDEWERSNFPTSWPLGPEMAGEPIADTIVSYHGRDLPRRPAFSAMRQELADKKRAYRATFGPLRAREDAVHEALADAQTDLCFTVPTSLEGILALLQYVREDQFVSESIFDGNPDGARAMMDSLEMAMHRTSGRKPPADLVAAFEEAERVV